MDSFLVENNGVTIEVRSGLGRVAVATRDFDVLYQTVMSESPALVWSSQHNQHNNNCLQAFLLAYDEADEAVQSSTQQLYHPPLDSIDGIFHVIRLFLPQAVRRFPHHSPEFIKKLLAISLTNAHDYFGYKSDSTEDSGDLTRHEIMDGSAANAKHSALFLFGSMPQHSCNPNVSYTSQTGGGLLVYKVIRKIKCGDTIEFAYIGDLFETPTYERRQRLHMSKNFWCMCSRCTAPDFTRVAPCRACSGERHPCCPAAPPEAAVSQQQQQLLWLCSHCGTNSTVVARIETSLRDELAQLQQGLQTYSSTLPLYRIRNEATSKLSATHFVALQAWKELSRLYASKAVDFEQTLARFAVRNKQMLPPYVIRQMESFSEGLSRDQLRQKASIYGLRYIALTECVAHRCCLGCNPGMFRHELVYSMAAPMLHACIDLMEIPVELHPHYAATMVERYLPVLQGHFGHEDHDVATIAERLLPFSSYNNSNCQGTTTSCAGRFCDGCTKIKAKKQGNLLQCARCNLAYYCSKECQIKAWKSGHKFKCLPKPE